jgi:hypothetical protein
MIKFFRKIRQNLLMENKTGKYFKYAIGEIILVVIGILIALQVNTLKIESEARKYELIMLGEINSALKQDINNQQEEVTHFKNKYKSVLKLVKLNTGEIKTLDSLEFHLRKLRIRRIFDYNDGPYESLKSSGMDKISNDSLRNKLSNLYSNALPTTGILFNEVLRSNIIENEKIFTNLFVDRIKVSDNQNIVDVLANDYVNKLNTREYFLLLRSSIQTISSFLRFHELCINEMKGVNNLIEKEISNQ